MKEFLLSAPALIVGFLLGILSPIITDWASRASKRRRMLRGIAVEANELRVTLAHAAPLMLSAEGALTPSHVAALRSVLVASASTDANDAGQTVVRAILSKGDEAYAQMFNSRATPGRGPWPVPYRLPFLELSVGELSLLSKETQAKILQILHQLHLFNEKVDLVKELTRLTFDAAIVGASREALEANLRSSQIHLAERAISTIATISTVVDLDGSPRKDAR
jgi:hypothetical protein